MIIHSFLTDGFFDWGCLFLESFKKYHGENIKIILDTRDLDKKQVNHLKSIYSNVDINNKDINMKRLVSETGKDEGTLRAFKHKIENNSVTTQNKVWKLFISVEERYRDSIWRVFKEYKDIEDFLLHMDIDIYFRHHIQEVFDFVKQHDISIRFRKKAISKGNENRCVLGNFITFKLNDKSEEFLKTWHKIINGIPLKKKPKGFGQTSFWRAYQQHKDNLIWGDLPPHLKVRGNNKNALMWSANKGSKNKILKLCREDMRG